MKIAAIKERTIGESRAAITPDTAKLYVQKGFKVFVEKNIGLLSNFSDEEYLQAGAKISSVPLEILSDADIILKVQASPLLEDRINEIDLATSGSCIIGLLKPYQNRDYINKAASKKHSLIAMEMVPRTSIAQGMDALSSQSNLAGYRAVIEAAHHFDRAFPMLMTAAGTITPAKVLILGVGVAGLQAIATAKRLGAIVSAYDVRLAAKEQAESLGAKFLHPELDKMKDAEDSKGYAAKVSDEFAKIQEEFLKSVLGKFDIIITTAQIPGQRAPRLINSDMFKVIKPGSVVVDMATDTGGNVDGSAIDQIVQKDGVKIIGWANLASKVPHNASKFYAKNLYNFLNYAIKPEYIKNPNPSTGGRVLMDYNDPLIKEMIVLRKGEVVNDRFK